MNAPIQTQATAGAAGIVDYAKSLDCIHCGLCLTTCPTYQLSGRESSSPRGRVHLMRAVAEARLSADDVFREEMEFCLVCRHCESVCPAGVQFGAMMEITRAGLLQQKPLSWLERSARRVGFGTLLVRRRALAFCMLLLRLAQTLGLMPIAAWLGGARGRALAQLPPVPPARERKLMPAETLAQAPEQARLAMLEGCVMPEFFGRVNRATAATLAAAGITSLRPRAHVCCGALHAHNGELAKARELARSTIKAFDELRDTSGSALGIVVNSAGCGAHMKEYERLLADDPEWRERAQAFSGRVHDYSEVLAAEPARSRLKAALASASGERVTYDDPCHLCHGQGIRAEPRILLDLIPNQKRVELEASESCCGSAGIYSLLRPNDSQAILAKKIAALRESTAQILITANPGCQLQWQSGIRANALPIRVMHLAEHLQESLAQQTASPRSSGAQKSVQSDRSPHQ